MSFDRAHYDGSRSRLEREKLREELRSCPEHTDLFYALPPDHVMSGTYSLLGMAVVADDPELIRKFAERLGHEVSPDSDELMYAGEYVALATFFESEMALEELLGMGMSAACPSSSKWNRSDFRLSECFAHHFHITRRAVDSVNGVSRWSFV